MKKFLITGILGAVLASSAAAGPLHWAGATVREFGRTSRDFITWKYPLVNVMFLADIGAGLADAQTTVDALHRGGVEQTSWLYGKQPSYHRVALTQVGISFGLVTLSHALSEEAKRDNVYSWGKFVSVAPQGLDALSEGLAAFHNTTTGERRLARHFRHDED